jgi:hypothetical protein
MDAKALATTLLAEVGTRLAHSATVARQAERVSGHLYSPWAGVLVDAAWLHDIGYSPSLVVCGFHPLDGARWLREHGWRTEVCRLVANHTRAVTEGQLRGLGDELTYEFPAVPELPSAVLAWSDLTSLPTGDCCAPSTRIPDILMRYPDGPVYEATLTNGPALHADVCLIEALLESVSVR